MQIKTYKDASTIEERYLPQLAKRQAECWWAKPFEEYKICMNENCKAIFSTEEVLWDVMNIRIPEIYNNNFSCKECWDDTEEIYEKEKFIRLMQEYFLWEVSALLIVDGNDYVEWFWIISKTSIRWVVELEFNTRPESYEIEQTIKRLGSILYQDENSGDRDVICFHQIYVSPLVRNAKLSYQALKDLFAINNDTYKDIPLIWEPRYDNRFYPILRSIGRENIIDDKYWYVIQYLKKYWDMLDFLDANNWYQDIISDMVKYKKEAQAILREHPEFTQRKYYK